MTLPELHTVEIGRRRMAWRERGDGRGLVLVHGIGGYSASWGPQLDAFAATNRVIAWDAPGYGGTDPLDSRFPCAADYAGALSALLTALGVESADFVGHSLGAVIVASLCRLRPGIARTVVFVHGVTGSGALAAEDRERLRTERAADLESLGMKAFAENRGRDILGRSLDPATAAEIIDLMADVPEAGYLAAWNMMCAANIYDDLSFVRCPALVIGGADDPVAPETVCRAIANRLSGAIVELLDGVGHFASLEAPHRLNALLDGFLSKDHK